MKRFFSAAALTFIVTAFCHAAGYSVRGTVADSIGEPEAYATVRVYPHADTAKVTAHGITADDGSFSLSLKTPGQYLLKIISIGRTPVSRGFSVSAQAPVADLGTLTVRADDKMLDEVTVTATKPLVTKEIDRIGYDVQADDDSKTATLDEMLRRVPLVSVDAEGNITVKGSSNFKIYKNGRPNNSFTRNAKDIFKAIPASMIKKIEVITDPGAREDAEGVGAILNIITLESTTMKGVTGNVSLNYDTRTGVPTPNFWGSTQIDKVTLSLYAGGQYMSKKQTKKQPALRNSL